MSIPAAAYDPDAHLQHMKQIADRLREEHAKLRKAPRQKPKRGMEGTLGTLTRIRRQGRMRAGSGEFERMRDGPRHRFVHRPPGRNRQTQLARMLTLVLLLHAIIIGGIVIADMVESSVIWKSIGCAVLIWMIFRGMAAISRHITPPQRTTTRVAGRNCDRDIWL